MSYTPPITYAFSTPEITFTPVRVLKSPLFWVLALILAAGTLTTLMYTHVLDKSVFHIILSADLGFLALCVAAFCYKKLLYEVTFTKLLVSKHSWWSEITPQLVLGAIPLHKHEKELNSSGITHYVSLTEDFEFEPSLWAEPLQHTATNSNWLHLPTRDFSAVSEKDLEKAVSWMREKIQAGGKVYVHCKGGKGRSAMVVARYLLAHGGQTKATVEDFLLSKRPQMHLSKTQRAGVMAFTPPST